MIAAFRASFFLAACLFSIVLGPDRAAAQERIWLQIEAQPSLQGATERARAYAAVFPETQGYKLRSGWYAIALGPYGVAEGAAQLTGLKRENLIPADSFISDGGDFRDQFWPAGGAEAPVVAPEPVPEVSADPLPDAPEAEVAAAPEPEPEPVVEPEETPQQARASEAELSAEEKSEIIRAYVGTRGDRRHKPGRAFEHARYEFDLLINIGEYRDLQRHRLVTIRRCDDSSDLPCQVFV